MNSDIFYKLLIFRSKGIGAVKYHELIRDFGGAEGAVEALSVPGDVMDSVRREMDLADSLGIKYLSDDSPDFPKDYKKLRAHSPILSVRGNTAALKKRMAAMVGTRHATAAGMAFMSGLAHDFAAHGYAVVSGMAMGTDSAAHHGALRASGDLQTIAVLAGGADYIWPLENERLYHEIIERGAIVSDMPVGFKPMANNFIARNRIVAGLAEMLILGEADEKSGSVATAGFTLGAGRPLWAIPGHPSDARSGGPNRFISDGCAKLCRGSTDFFDMVPDKKPMADGKEKKFETSGGLLDLIGSVPASENVLTALAKKNISEVSGELVILELGGLIKKVDGGYVRV
ncbi:MAG: DNA-protecting protein DprA [Rickettsiales bacterium]|jgi:DNA processing protein|nr:DNA-protecting protein DprA [Rickettsiales bacterium]